MDEELYFLGVKALIQNANGEALLLEIHPGKLIKTKDWNGQTYFDLPGGRVKKGDSIEATLRKEVAEETGNTDITIVHSIAWTLSNIRIPTDENESHGLILVVYRCTSPETVVTLSDEHTAYAWMPMGRHSKSSHLNIPKRQSRSCKRTGMPNPARFPPLATSGFCRQHPCSRISIFHSSKCIGRQRSLQWHRRRHV